MADVLYIVVPAYNEEENLRRLVDEWYPVLKKHDGAGASRLVIIDDGSKDNTFSLLKELSESRPLLIPLTKENGGHGSTVLYGYRYALNNGADYVFQTDSDGQTNAEEFEPFWDERTNFDAVIGDRSDRQDGYSRVMVEKVLLLLLRLIFGVKIPDSNAPFRLMRADLLKKYLSKIPEDFNLPNVILTTFFVYYKEKVAFRHVSFKPRQGGKNSINLKKIFRIGWKAVGDFRRIQKQIHE